MDPCFQQLSISEESENLLHVTHPLCTHPYPMNTTQFRACVCKTVSIDTIPKIPVTIETILSASWREWNKEWNALFSWSIFFFFQTWALEAFTIVIYKGTSWKSIWKGENFIIYFNISIKTHKHVYLTLLTVMKLCLFQTSKMIKWKICFTSYGSKWLFGKLIISQSS